STSNAFFPGHRMTLRSSASSAAHGLRLDVRDALLRFARVRARRMLLHELAVLLERALRIALRLERLSGHHQGFGVLVRQVVEHLDLEELRERGVEILRCEVHLSELDVRARREAAFVERDRALERAARIARAVEVRERLA